MEWRVPRGERCEFGTLKLVVIVSYFEWDFLYSVNHTIDYEDKSGMDDSRTVYGLDAGARPMQCLLHAD